MRKRNAMLALLSLGVQPLQFFGLQNIGQAAAAPMELVEEFQKSNAAKGDMQAQWSPADCLQPMGVITSPITTDPLPKPCPETIVLPPITAPTVTYYLLPGLGDNTPKINNTDPYYSSYFDGADSGLHGFLMSSNRAELPVRVESPYASWKTQGIAAQATALANRLNTDTNPNNKMVLIGHSMGGVRGRQALQFNKSIYTPKVAGLVTIGSPHSGAPIIDNGLPQGSKLAATLGVAFGTYGGPASAWLGAAVGLFGANAFIAPLTHSPSGRDLAPNSAFIQTLNNPGANTIPAHVKTLRVSGGNNEVDSLAASVMSNATTHYSTASIQEMRRTLATFFFGASYVSVLIGLFAPWLLVAAAAFAAAAYFTDTLPTFWKRKVVGSDAGDAIVPASSQLLPASAGGGPRFEVLLTQAVHSGMYSEYQVQEVGEYTNAREFKDSLRNFQFEIGATRSN